jgi:hypothetical protein
MSRNAKNTPTPKPHCKVCFDAGKPESEYTSHWVRTLPDRNGKSTVTCPTLLNTECRYCYQSGHTTKFCKVLEKHNKERERAETVSSKKKEVMKTTKTSNANAFALLCEDSDTEEKVSNTNTNTVIEYPALSEKKPVEKTVEKTGWAAIVAKPAEVKKVAEPTKPTGLVMLSDYLKPVEEKKVEQAKVAPWANKQVVAKKSWADESDSEDEFDPDMYDEDLKWRNTYVPGMSDDTWARVNGDYDETW